MNTELLRNILKDQKICYPAEAMTEIPQYVNGPGFFPGFSGTEDDAVDLTNKILFLGQDQDTKNGFKRSLKVGNEEYTPTWQRMKDLLDEAELPMKDCFFTNALMGLRTGASNVGVSPGFNHPEFVSQCLEFFVETVKQLEPKAIVCLGLRPAKFLSLASHELALRIGMFDEFKQIDNAKAAVHKSIALNDIPDFKTAVVILTHPSYRHLNAQYRRFESKQKDLEPEAAMLNSIL